jgi:hypothetical protein
VGGWGDSIKADLKQIGEGTGFLCLRVGTSDGVCEYDNESSVYTNDGDFLISFSRRLYE